MNPQAPRLSRRFLTQTGIEVPVVTAAETRELDRIATEETGPNLFQMMENAGRELALLTIELLGDRWNKDKVEVLAGPGGNGGGGICCARHLANHGLNVKLCLAEPDRLGPVSSLPRKIFRRTSGTEVERADLVGDGSN